MPSTKDHGSGHAGRHRIEGFREPSSTLRPISPHRIDSSKLMVKRESAPAAKRSVISFQDWSDEDLAFLAPILIKAAANRPGDFIADWGNKPFPKDVEGTVSFFVASGFSREDAERVVGKPGSEPLSK